MISGIVADIVVYAALPIGLAAPRSLGVSLAFLPGNDSRTGPGDHAPNDGNLPAPNDLLGLVSDRARLGQETGRGGFSACAVAASCKTSARKARLAAVGRASLRVRAHR